MNFRSLLCLNGDLPDADYFKRFTLPVIAADGAANRLMEYGVTPDHVVGDLDSINEDVLACLPHTHVPNQDTCDFEKCIRYLEDHQLLPTLVLGMNGGRFDHMLNNVSVLSQLVGQHQFYVPPFYGIYAPAQRLRVKTDPAAIVSLIGIPSASVRSCGLVWELNGEKLAFPGKNSCLNRATAHMLELAIDKGVLLILIESDNPLVFS